MWIFLFLNLAGKAFGTSYGSYYLSRNYGLSYYDYGAGLYHGYIGDDPSTKTSGPAQTDRGAYFSGSNSYITLHSSHWTPPPALPAEWFLVCWALPEASGLIFSRYSVIPKQNNEAKELAEGGINSSNQLYFNVEFTHSSLVGTLGLSKEKTAPFTMSNSYSDVWSMVSFVVRFDGIDSGKIELYVNELKEAESTFIPSYYYYESPTDTLETFGGGRASGNTFKGFIYSVEIIGSTVFLPSNF